MRATLVLVSFFALGASFRSSWSRTVVGGVRRRAAARPGVDMIAGKLRYLHLYASDPGKMVAFYDQVFGLTVQRTGEGSPSASFVAAGSEMNGEHFSLKIIDFPAADADVSRHVSLVLFAKSLDDVVSAVPGLGGEVVAEPEAITLGPSLVPDEEMETKIELRRAIVRDPSGYSIEVIEGERTDPVGRVVLPVTDLDRAIDFYTGSMGMTMHRKRSLVPLEPAMCAYLSFADSEDASTLLELRYNYATKRISTGSVAQHLTISTPDVPAVVDSLVADAPVSARGESDATVGDPEGYGLELMDELELLKQTLG